jgi:large subunit ribosomal protein L37e
MGKGTPSRSGGKTVHVRCRRCGRHSYHQRKRTCASCGFGVTSRMRGYSWAKLKGGNTSPKNLIRKH